MLRWLKTVVVSDAEKARETRQVGAGKTVRSPCDSAGITGEASKLFRWHQNRADVSGLG